MSKRIVTHQIKLPLSLTIILGLIAFGLIANVLKPVLKIDEAFAASEVHRIAICNERGTLCAGISKPFDHVIEENGGGMLTIRD